MGGTIAGTPLPRRPCTVLARPTRGRTPEGQRKTARNGARRGRVNRRKRRKTTPPPSGGGERSTQYADSHTSCARPSARRPPTPPVPAHSATRKTQPALPSQPRPNGWNGGRRECSFVVRGCGSAARPTRHPRAGPQHPRRTGWLVAASTQTRVRSGHHRALWVGAPSPPPRPRRQVSTRAQRRPPAAEQGGPMENRGCRSRSCRRAEDVMSQRFTVALASGRSCSAETETCVAGPAVGRGRPPGAVDRLPEAVDRYVYSWPRRGVNGPLAGPLAGPSRTGPGHREWLRRMRCAFSWPILRPRPPASPQFAWSSAPAEHPALILGLDLARERTIAQRAARGGFPRGGERARLLDRKTCGLRAPVPQVATTAGHVPRRGGVAGACAACVCGVR